MLELADRDKCVELSIERIDQWSEIRERAKFGHNEAPRELQAPATFLPSDAAPLLAATLTLRPSHLLAASRFFICRTSDLGSRSIAGEFLPSLD